MKHLPHLASRLFYSPLLLTPQRHAVYCQFLDAHLAGTRPVAQTDTEDESEDAIEPDVVGNTLIIPVHGTIVQFPEEIAMSECGCPLEELNALIEQAEYDNAIQRVIYDFRTPGGGVTGVPETARKILRSEKETIAFTNSECCSAGMWLASQCQRFYSTPSATLGSIGVWCAYLDWSKNLHDAGVNVQAISAGKFKLLGAYWKPLSEEERGILQKDVDKIYEQFRMAMQSQRSVSEENMGNGLVFDGDEAASRGLTDGTVEDLEEVLEGLTE